MPVFQLISSVSLDYRGSPIARAVADFTASADVELLFGGPRWDTGWVDAAQPFKLLTISTAGVISDVSAALPAGVVATHARELVAADFNRDGRADAYSANHGFDGSTFPGETDDLFMSGTGGMVVGQLPDRTDFTHSVDVGDIDGDGDLDILVGNFGDLGTSHSGPYFLKNDGAGNFTVSAGGLSGSALGGLSASKLVDVDGDGDLDFVGGGHGDSPTSAGWVWLNNGQGTFTNDPSRALPVGRFGKTVTIDVASLDFDGDGDKDLILSQTRADPFYQDSALQFLENDGTGRFTDVTAQRMPVQDTSANWANAVYTADVNGDGHLDLVMARSFGGTSASIALNDGAGRYVAIPAEVLGLQGIDWTPVDFDRDGRTDIVTFSRDIPTTGPLVVSVYRNTGAAQLTPTSANDTLIAGQDKASVDGGLGNDFVLGGDADDYLRGGDGDDRIAGGDGFDDTHGNMGNDTVSGGMGPDWVVGGKDNDVLYGDQDHDVVYGNIGNDVCYGGEGNDVVRGGQNDDVVRGEAGDDWLAGDKGDDTVTGGAGADIFHTHGEANLDRVTDFNRAEGDRVYLLPGTQYTLAQEGADVAINMVGGGKMVLVGVQLASLTGDWIFGA